MEDNKRRHYRAPTHTLRLNLLKQNISPTTPTPVHLPSLLSYVAQLRQKPATDWKNPCINIASEMPILPKNLETLYYSCIWESNEHN